MTRTPRTPGRRAALVVGLTAALTTGAALGGCGIDGPGSASGGTPADPTAPVLSRPTAPSTLATPSPEPSPPPSPTVGATTPAAPPSTAAPAPPGPSGPRPATGREFVRTGPRGPGELVVENGTGQDGYVTLARDRRARVTVYVRAGATTRVRGVADGTYELFFATGDGWNDRLRAFTSAAEVQRFDDSFAFRTDSDSSTKWTVSLQADPRGTASSSPVDPSTVPR